MSVIYVRDILETKYITNAMARKFDAALTNLYKPGDVVDLAGCKFGPEAAVIISQKYPYVDFRNSEDEELDKILKNNTRIKRSVAVEPYEKVDFTKIKNYQDLLELSKTIPQGAKIEPVVSGDVPKPLAALILLMLTRTDIEYDIYYVGSFIGEYICDEWRFIAEDHDTYIEFTQPGFRILEVDEYGCIGPIGKKKVPKDIYINQHLVLPGNFGSYDITANTTESGKYSGEYSGIISKCIKELTAKQAVKKTLLSMLQYRVK